MLDCCSFIVIISVGLLNKSVPGGSFDECYADITADFAELDDFGFS
jgi:hypothetical protein